jgi:hypothetical protein
MAVAEIRASLNTEKLNVILAPLVGQPCVRVTAGHAGNLILHFGDEVPLRSKRLAGKTRGSWVFDFLSTPMTATPLNWWAHKGGAQVWSPLFPFGGPLFPAEADQVAAHLEEVLVGARVAQVIARGFDVGIEFDNGPFIATLEQYAANDLCTPAWTVLMPEKQYLEVYGHPTPSWSLLPSDRPA